MRFTKMHGLGNDFVMIDGVSQKIKLNEAKLKFLADRRFGIGCDQILLVEAPRSAEADFRYRIFNADGSEVENCGNGARCFARFVSERKLTGKQIITVETAGGNLVLKLLKNGDVEVDMGKPQLEPAQIPFHATDRAPFYSISLDDRSLEIGAVSMGNPHAVLLVDDVATCPLEVDGPRLEKHHTFPNRVNVGFMEVVTKTEIRLRVFERGVGETLACGTGACAAVVAGRLRGLLDEKVSVHLPGGQLSISWPGEGENVTMAGPATTVYHGQIKV